MPRFVILEHDHPFLHWDLMLEMEDTLRTWRLFQEPKTNQWIPIEPSFDHRKIYLDYEGPISKNRGTVKRWRHGTYEWIDLESDLLKLLLRSDQGDWLTMLDSKNLVIQFHDSLTSIG